MDFSSPSRLLAPAALILALVAVGAIVASSTGGEEETPPAAETSQEGEGRTTRTSTTPARAQTTPRTETTESGPETYTVQSGDTFGSIAEETDVSVAELQELNPELDPQTLTVGDTVRLRR